MRKVVLKMHVSLDGYVRAASGDVMDWVFRTYDDELKAWEVDLLWQAGTHIMGRRLCEGCLLANFARNGQPRQPGQQARVVSPISISLTT